MIFEHFVYIFVIISAFTEAVVHQPNRKCYFITFIVAFELFLGCLIKSFSLLNVAPKKCWAQTLKDCISCCFQEVFIISETLFGKKKDKKNQNFANSKSSCSVGVSRAYTLVSLRNPLKKSCETLFFIR